MQKKHIGIMVVCLIGATWASMGCSSQPEATASPAAGDAAKAAQGQPPADAKSRYISRPNNQPPQ